jgi:hypothetical protein
LGVLALGAAAALAFGVATFLVGVFFTWRARRGDARGDIAARQQVQGVDEGACTQPYQLRSAPSA